MTTTEINWGKVEEVIRTEIPDLASSEMKVKRFTEGYSNLTYFVQIGDWKGVLRRPPFGKIPAKAHDMEREYQLLRKINPVFPLSPKPYFFCDDENVMERPFYVMEYKEGIVIDDEFPSEYADIEDAKLKVSQAMVDTLIALHEIDYKEASLTDIGKPEGYLERQVHGWMKRFHAVKIEEIEGLEEMEQWLLKQLPPSPPATLVHNDYKLNNLMFSYDNPEEIVGVFDWEMATIGDPLSDLGLALAYWAEDGSGNTGVPAVTSTDGFLTPRELIERYAQKSGRDMTHINYYVAFSFYKIAVILAQIYYRWKKGETTDVRFAQLDEGVKTCIERAILTKNGEFVI